MPNHKNRQWSKETNLNLAGINSDSTHGSVTPPLFLSSNFSFEGFGQKRPYDYSRSGNPTRDVLGDAIAQLEGGYGTVITSSGMSALDNAFSLLNKDDLVIAPHDCYGGTYRLLSHRQQKGHFNVKFVDLTDSKNLPEIFQENVAMVLVETPSNPLLRITDIAEISQHAKQKNALLVVDNTFLSPILQNPIALGADIVVHSNTKYINGHSDVVGGSVISKEKELHERLAWLANCTGITGAPFDSFLTLRGLRTLPLRVREQSKNANYLAHFLDTHPAVGKVYYPGLKEHTGHDIAVKQQRGFGGMISFELSDIEKIPQFVDDLSGGSNKLFTLAESLGGFESLIAHPATMTHASMTTEERQRAGIKDNLLRLSIGIDDKKDLKSTLKYALDRACKPR